MIEWLMVEADRDKLNEPPPSDSSQPEGVSRWRGR